jgi:hypothetical protein
LGFGCRLIRLWGSRLPTSEGGRHHKRKTDQRWRAPTSEGGNLRLGGRHRKRKKDRSEVVSSHFRGWRPPTSEGGDLRLSFFFVRWRPASRRWPPFFLFFVCCDLRVGGPHPRRSEVGSREPQRRISRRLGFGLTSP